MRIDRIRLKDFCGISDTEVQFAPKGVTIVHGPNEVGKSTLMQGINVLFDHRDDSRKEEVRLTKPVNRDVGSEVEADVEIGEYRFTYFKRFHKDRETRLSIHAPRAENLTGREAHDRVQQILSASLDTSLWMALRIVQGENLQMPELHNQPALAQALDRAAGQAKSGEREEGLFDAAHAEYLAYFTDRGREKEDPVGRVRTRATAAAGRTRELQEQLRALEIDIARYADLSKASATLQGSLPGLDKALVKAQETWNVVSTLSDDVDRRKNAHQSSEQSLTAAKNSVQQRDRLIEAAKDAGKRVDGATTRDGELSRTNAGAATSLESATQARDSARKAADRAETDERLRRADREFRQDELELVRMEERLDHIKTAEAAASAASDLIAATAITEKLRAGIRDAELKLGTARGILNAASPQLHITALLPLPVVIDGKAATLDAGEERAMAVAESISARFGESVEIRVEPGTSAEALQQEVHKAEQALKKACEKAGVATPEEAESAWTALQSAKRTVADRDRIVKNNLRDLTREDLEARVRSTGAKVSAYLAKRNSPLPLPANLDDAAHLLVAAEKAAAEARESYRRAEDSCTQATELRAKRRQDHAVNAALLEQARNDLKLADDRLRDDRNRSGDGDLATALATAGVAVRQSLDALNSAQTKLNNADPQTAKAILETAKSAYSKAQDLHAQQERELLQLRTKLDLLGEQGLAEALDESSRVAYEAEDSLARLLRRAGAAKLLFETLQTERDVTRRTYVAPLREGIERLGRHVFGPSVRVEVDENLRIVNRTMDGITVALEQLSTGAQEQMGLLVRLATALIVAKDGGVPLVLDDALGSTDQGRLEAMGAVLRIASQDTQTIILTCSPERYVHVGAQAMVSM
jgi:energy-coupling factor transporter ATP-binding protein EcfA2